MTTPSKADFPVEGGRPSLKWGRKISESLAGARITSPDHMISEGPGGTCIKHKRPYDRGSASTLPEATVLYKVMAVREFLDSDNSLVAIGSETGGAGRHYDWVEDWVRAH
jgi:hypothetical protein